jgi:hypothetical protein
MYIRSNVSGSIETENRLLSEMSDTTVFKVGNSEIAVCWNPDLWKKDKKENILK